MCTAQLGCRVYVDVDVDVEEVIKLRSRWVSLKPVSPFPPPGCSGWVPSVVSSFSFISGFPRGRGFQEAQLYIPLGNNIHSTMIPK